MMILTTQTFDDRTSVVLPVFPEIRYSARWFSQKPVEKTEKYSPHPDDSFQSDNEQRTL